MKRIMVLIAVALSVGLISANGVYRTAAHAAGPVTPSRTLQFSYVVHVPALPGGSRELRLWLPLPYQDLYQSISELRVESPVPYVMRQDSQYNDRYAYLAVSAAKANSKRSFTR